MARDAEFLRATMPALDLVHNLARRLARDRAAAEDLVQETYLRAWQAWCAHRRPDRVAPWLATICLNAARDEARRRGRRPEAPLAYAVEPPDPADVAEMATGRVLRGQVEAALAGLPEPQRVAVVLMDLCGLTASEVAEVTGSPRGTVLSRVHRGRLALAALVAQRGGERHEVAGS